MTLIKRIFSCLLLSVITHVAFSQGIIEFISEKDVEVIIYKPIDGGYNNFYPTDTIKLAKDEKQIYHIDVADWAIIKCQFPQKMPLDVFIERNDTICVINRKQDVVFKNGIIYESDITFKGANAAANDYLYLYISAKEQKIRAAADSIFKTKDTKLIDEIVTTPLLMVRSLGIVEKIDSMYINKQISYNCYNYLRKNLDYRLRYMLLRGLDDYCYEGYINDSVQTHYKNRIIDETLIDYSDIRSIIGSSFVGDYYWKLYGRLDNDIKECMISKYGKETFGSYYISSLLAPAKIQLNLLFKALILEYKYKRNSFNRFKMFEYINSRYPESESVQIVRKFVEEEAKDTIPVQTTFLDNIPINSFSDIQQLIPFKGKYLFIDIWASWCVPCRSEFVFNKQLNEILEQYPNVAKLYISIDEKEDEWKKAVEAMRISGFHVRASDRLAEYLIQEVYQSGRIYVPRYILIDNTGQILSADLPRPSSMEKLTEEMDKFLR
ncbi:TlpA disulfide reductase family protein [uncultured Bacteroides sp.]|uniref:TlpA family protein disulfide reductase n=1 Tax=uncultured Bacteroides sp. TaxID=162156 RepID=UPI0025DEBEB4|nr:TlpA disulfide reductase family protein [uncultured Bacteroides sp.]